ncbi:hypothetical protein [Shimazuella alba]|uniref:DUF4367 domain-containing protein n=1 Tax=Shimazuella alba TaxID=2690964 RepID=A0A6I4VZS9_9BACL|nr:hypothetical protein [Shimazuella alba]MXQ53572.1 hypothetical protein [Shimazuella alba]
MNEKKIDDLVRKSLRNNTESAIDSKEHIWNNIQNQLNKVEKQNYQKRKTFSQHHVRKRKKWISITATIACLFLAIFFTTTTKQGQALITTVRQWFEPKKSIQQELEGMKENTNVNLQGKDQQSPQEASFILYVDEQRYHVIKERDQFLITVDLPEKYPEVYMDITQKTGVKPQDAIQQIQQEMTAKYSHVGKIKQVKSPVTGYQLRADQGNKKWNDEVVVYYVVSNKQNGSFIIKQKYFLEASEGHGVRFDNMLKDFKVIPNAIKPKK